MKPLVGESDVEQLRERVQGLEAGPSAATFDDAGEPVLEFDESTPMPVRAPWVMHPTGDIGLFPITLVQTGGTAVADDTTQADWTYTVTDARTGKELGTAVNPTAGNHKWVRPAVGYMTAATAGMAYKNAARELVILWINEVVGQGPCTE